MMTKLKKCAISSLACVCAACVTTGAAFYAKTDAATAEVFSSIQKISGSLQTNTEDYFDESVIYKLPETLSDNDDVSVIVSMETESVMQAYENSTSYKSASDFASSVEGYNVALNVSKESNKLIKQLKKAGVSFTLGETYDTILSGFEITIKAKDFDTVNDILGTQATLIIGEEYEPAETEVVTNEVDVYETGIFDSSEVDYQGDGVVVAVLDTGLDYTHTAFSVDNFTTSQESFTLKSVSSKISQTVASQYSTTLTGEDVYVSSKVPYAYDYADKDPDVFPINSEHGTHVAGIIAGNDDTITGVAPNAQLAIMKVFSDTASGAKTSWILAALEDCVVLGVDVINMSLGTSCGFSREVDKDNVNNIYDSIKEAGISLICAASNDYNATHASTKNGSNGLTSNPDSGTVGSPSTYDAALSVASVDGVKTSYLLNDGEIIYFNEATNSAAKKKDFVSDILATVGDNVTSHDFEYVTIPGIGRSSDYTQDDSYYKGKIVLVKRGTTTFEDKIRVALVEKGAAGIIVYNNVSGTISMSVGQDVGAACSISQDDGEKLAAKSTGIITISTSQKAGPFMSDFSSWGPTSDLKIKPEITAHGGEILSAVPGQSYDRLSGTSMAAPNQAGATALVRQYVKYSGVFGTNVAATKTTAIVNQLMMSTADIVYNKNGLPYAVRKQGAGLVNISKALSSAAYITTYDTDGNAMDKTKLELGDDKDKTGVYEMTFSINNISNTKVTYDVNSIIMTEGVSSTYTSHGDTTVTQDGKLLEGTKTTVTNVSGGEQSGNTVSVAAYGTATVKVKIVLSDEDKQYMNESFANGMYVEGFITLTATSGTTVDMSIPMLAFYGDWTEAPIFDEEYYDTNVDELNSGLDDEDKLMADAYATRVLGSTYSDYIAYLGSYYFVQDPSATQIAASKDHIALSNQENGDSSSAVNSLYAISAGLLRNVKELEISIVEDSTGKEIFNKVEYNQRKSYSSGSSVYASSIDCDFSVLENNLKNNTQYTVTITTYIDYGTKEEQNNKRNTFTFPLYIDFEAPVITGVEYSTEYDRTTKQTKLYADVSVYDNHYAMGITFGQIVENSSGSLSLNSFGKYVTPVYSEFNSTSVVRFELTDYVSQLKNSAGYKFYADGSYELKESGSNTFVATCYDYALNSATYELTIPDEVISLYFNQNTYSLSPNETLDISSILNLYPMTTWVQALNFESDNTACVDIVNETILAIQSGSANIIAYGYDANGNKVSASVTINVLSEGDEGYNGSYTLPEVNKFSLTGYTTNKAYYSISSSEREIGITGGTYYFGTDYTLSMYPSESVTLTYLLDSYFPDATSVVFKAGNSRIATVSEDGTIVAQAEGKTIVTVNVTYNGKSTLYQGRVTVTVKDPFTINSIYLNSYKGLGGTVTIPSDRGITTIYSYAFSNYKYVEKDTSNGDVIDDEDPYHIKQMYIGEDTITKVIIPEGVTEIQSYAFANLTALEEVVLPTTLIRIGVGAFLGCTKLTTINLENVKFINKQAFSSCALTEVNLNSVVAIGDYAFENGKLNTVILPSSSQSLGIGAFMNNANLTIVQFKASKINIGSYAFAECPLIVSIDINAAVISSYAFYKCTNLTSVTLEKDVSVIGEYAFAGTNVSSFKINAHNKELTAKENGALVYKGDELILVAPNYRGTNNKITITTTSISTGAFAGNTKIFEIVADNVKTIGAHAFDGCTNLSKISMASVTEIGDYAFYKTALEGELNLTNIKYIGYGAFASTNITSVIIPDNAEIDSFAFANCFSLNSVTIGNNVNIGTAAFYCTVTDYSYPTTGSISTSYYDTYSYEVTNANGVTSNLTYYTYKKLSGIHSNLTTLIIGSNVTIGEEAFYGNGRLSSVTLGSETVIGDAAFYNDFSITNIDLSQVTFIGSSAFSGEYLYDYMLYTYNGTNYVINATEYELVNGVSSSVGYIYKSLAPELTSVDISSVKEVNSGAFAFNRELTSVTFNSELVAIQSYAFALTNLANVTLPETVTYIGDYAFYGTPLTSINISDVQTVGGYAFASTKLTTVDLENVNTLGEYAFAYCRKLTNVQNLQNVKSIGDYAFTYVAISEANLQNAVQIGDYAFANSGVTSVTFGENLASLGENPFYNCAISTFGKTQDTYFNGTKVGEDVIESYVISNTVQVINGVLYQTVPNGLELVSYPMNKADSSYVVEDETVRISARAFEGASLSSVTLPISLVAIGDKAFYNCANLSMVVFQSYDAPILEEEYDTSYVTYTTFPFTGYYSSTYQGLGIAPYYMWNVVYTGGVSYNNFYYGANFVNYIGQVENKLVMVKPSNGQGYDTFILGQYFDVTVAGNNAPTSATLAVIKLIQALPKVSQVTLDSEDQIVIARTAYDAIPSVEQQALVTNYSTLTDAESQLAYLKYLQNPDQDKDKDEGDKTVVTKSYLTAMIIGFVLAGVAILVSAGLVAYIFLNKKKSAGSEAGSTENPSAKE